MAGKYLFKLVPNPACKKQSGCIPTNGWLEVLAIVPTAIITEEGVQRISNDYICRTQEGIMNISHSDIWHSIDDYDELMLEQ